MEQILYETQTFCPVCTILDRKGLVLKPAIVVERNEKIYLKCLCDQQHQQTIETLYCSSNKFFKRMMSYDPVIGTNKLNGNGGIKDIESMGKYINKDDQPEIAKNPTSSNFILEFNIFQNQKFLNDEEIKQQLLQFQTYYPKNRKFVLKIIARGCNDIVSINEKVRFISVQLKGYAILLECTLDRLHSIAKLGDSALLGAKVYPAVKYFLKRGDENHFIRDINNLLNVLREYSDIQCVVTIAMERKFANLGEILSLLRKNNTLIRFIVLSLERPPKELVESLKIKNQLSLDQVFTNNSSTNNSDIQDTLCCNFNDPYELIQEIERATDNTICSDDFFPLNIGQALEPMFNLMGYGLYSIKPSSYCSFATCLVNTDTVESRPINRLLNFSKLYYDLLPILPNIEEKIGFFNGLKIKSLLKNCNLPGVPLPNIFDYLTDKSKAETTRKVIDQTQILIIHNNMDLASLDLKRRCHCSVETKIKDGYISSCTGCI
ncbi:hypothetical protein DICPUDRAFT_31657 [Dictyostelium purpureum]|uniref:Uncharacterized protein n=1 Tax=Dictyostelium purpureum TaxID=5786 RepID=F0ZHK3_DICPU|nr:uncharacterized protein DICPUDRAFT_31657 [Dictyostelium purpureum]EGC36586.1 hypothetical protein DICPUDRAFT_31657 [Dictyostelium purpureum]|eukprot:XP_003286890.1 hypothetical protein DICPUDRAFT_31657 [Dictyostelium purpureum]